MTVPGLHANLDLPTDWVPLPWEGTIGGAQYRFSTQGFTPNVLVTLDKWEGKISPEQAIKIVSEQLRRNGAKILTTSELGGEPPQVELQTEAKQPGGMRTRIRYRIQLLHVADDTLVVTAIATYLRTQENAIASDLDRILDSVALSTSSGTEA